MSYHVLSWAPYLFKTGFDHRPLLKADEADEAEGRNTGPGVTGLAEGLQTKILILFRWPRE